MAQHVSNSTMHVKVLVHGCRCMLLGALLAIGAAAVAGNLVDPTRPPASIASGQADAAVAPASPLLQSVLISPHRKEAIIAGRTVKVGDRVDEARVVKITESEVVLQNGKDLQTLKLFPDLEKKPASIAAEKSDSQRNKVKDK